MERTGDEGGIGPGGLWALPGCLKCGPSSCTRCSTGR